MRVGTPKKSSEPRASTPTGRRGTPLGGRNKKVAAPTPKATKGADNEGKENNATARPQPPEASNADASGEVVETAASSASRVTVAVRIKPTDGAKTLMRFGPRQENALRFCHLDGAKSDEAKGFAYDHLFDQSDSQKDVYDALGGQVLQQVINGYNASVFAYGQTGSGKTYTMLGTPAERGLIPRLCEGLFGHEALKGWNVTVSFYEIYNEQVVDLLHPPEDREKDEAEAKAEWAGAGLAPSRKVPVLNALRVREHVKLGVYVEGLTKQPVHSSADVERALEQGTSLRAVAETAMNAESSRSHAVVQICLAEGESGDRTATLNLIDLAGSENVNRSKSYEDHNRLTEARSINKSLLGLGKCISMLAQGGQGPVPYRDSVLTWILKDALGGNAHTLMLCAVDPSPDNGEQTLTTLRYADQAKKIVTRPVENIDHTKKMVRELHEQVAELRAAAEAAAQAQTAAREQAAEAAAQAQAAAQAAADAAAEREEARAQAAAARESAQMERAERARWEEMAAERERSLLQKEEELKTQAVEKQEAAQQAAAALQVALAEGPAARAGAAGGAPEKRSTFPSLSPKGWKGTPRSNKPGVAVAAAAAVGQPAAGQPAVLGLPAEVDIDAVAKMTRDEKLAFAKKLKEERKALHTALGIEEEPKTAPAEEAKAADAKAAVDAKAGALATTADALPPPPALVNVAFKCLGFLFTMNVVAEAGQESSRDESSRVEPPPPSRAPPPGWSRAPPPRV